MARHGGPLLIVEVMNSPSVPCGHPLRYGVKLIDTASVRNCGMSKFVRSNARIESKNGTTTIVNSTFSGASGSDGNGGDGVYVLQQEFSSNVLILKDVTARSNYRDGFLFVSVDDFIPYVQHKIKLEGKIRVNDNWRNGMDVAEGNVIQVFGQVEVKNNGLSCLDHKHIDSCSGGFYLIFTSEVNMTLIGDDDATFTSCNNTVNDMVNMNYGQEKHGDDKLVERTEFNPKDGAYFCDTKYRHESGRLPNCRPCDSSPELV